MCHCCVPLLCSGIQNGLVLISYKESAVLPAEHYVTLCYNVHVMCVENLPIVFVTKMAHCVKLIISVHHEDIFPQLVKYPSFYSTHNPIFLSTTPLHLFLSTLSGPPSPTPIYLSFILISPSNCTQTFQALPSTRFSPPKYFMHLSSPVRAIYPAHQSVY